MQNQLSETPFDYIYPNRNYQINTSLAAPVALAYRLQRRTTCNT